MPVDSVWRSADYWVDLGNGGGVHLSVFATGDSWKAATRDVVIGDVDALYAEAQSIFRIVEVRLGRRRVDRGHV